MGHTVGWERRRNVQDLGEVKRDFSEELTDQLILEEQTQLAGQEVGGQGERKVKPGTRNKMTHGIAAPGSVYYVLAVHLVFMDHLI